MTDGAGLLLRRQDLFNLGEGNSYVGFYWDTNGVRDDGSFTGSSAAAVFWVDVQSVTSAEDVAAALNTVINNSTLFTSTLNGATVIITYPVALPDATGSHELQAGSFAASPASNATVVNAGTTLVNENLTLQSESDTWSKYKSSGNTNDSNQDYDALDHNRLDNRGRRYGLDPQYAQQNGTFYIDQPNGYIHFGSDLAGETIVLHYISDGLGTDAEMVVHKFAEEAMYKWIQYGIISSKSNIPNYIVERFKKERFAESRKAKIRLSNIKMEEFTQVLRGLSKPIK